MRNYRVVFTDGRLADIEADSLNVFDSGLISFLDTQQEVVAVVNMEHLLYIEGQGVSR